MSSILTLAAFGFYFWMFYDRARYEPGKTLWSLLILLFNILGAVPYFLLRWLPRSLPYLNSLIHRTTRQRELQRAITAARTIGEAHQFVKLGHIYWEMRQGGPALAAYRQALSKAPMNLEALWGTANIELKNKNFKRGVMLLQHLIAVKPDYKFGDASLAYGQALFDLGDVERAQPHLEAHLKQWDHPEASLLFAQIQAQQNNTLRAREVLERMIASVQSSSAFHYRKYRKQVAQGQRMLKKIT